jgi:hypothetical protein
MLYRNKVTILVWSLTAAFALFMLYACEQKTYGPPLETQCKFETPLSVNVVVLDDKTMREKWEYYNRQELPDGAKVEGFAIYNKVTGLHTLFVLEIRGQGDSRRIETIGHELMHSFCGDWHPRNYG